MRLYIRFLHLASNRHSFLAVESWVVLGVLLLFAAAPLRFLPFFPNCGFRRLAQQRRRACCAVFLLSLVGRLLLLPIEPFPPPNVHDEFSYLLAGDTLAHARLANPTPPLWHHFEAFYVLLQPTYASRYGVALPLFLAAGQKALHSPRAGVVLSMALAAGSLCWMLQAYLPPQWALLGGLLAVARISWFSYFGNTYWGGSVAMLGGCLLLGAAVRFHRSHRTKDGIWLALGLLLLLNSRPFEGALVALPTCLYTLARLIQRRAKPSVWLPGLLFLLSGAACTACYFHRVTGAFNFPWVVYWRQWSLCPPFVFGTINTAVHYRFADQETYNRSYELLPYLDWHTGGGWLIETIVKCIYQWLFFIFPALTLTLVGLVPTLRARSYRPLMATLLLTVGGFLCETLLQAQYAAVITGILYLIMLNGLRWMLVQGRRHRIWLKLLRGTLAAVVVMVLVRLIVVPGNTLPPNWASQTGGIPAYEDVHRIMEALAGPQLVIVRYRKGHAPGYSWINNSYDLRSQHVVWARDTEPEESNLPLLCLFLERRVWLLVPPETGFLRPPDRTAPWNGAAAAQFLKPYPQAETKRCPAP